MLTVRQLLIATAWCSGAACAGTELRAQQSVGSVSLQDATVTGALRVSEGRAQMLGGTTVTANEHTAELSLTRGGTVDVCATSALHIASGRNDGSLAPNATPLLLALDRGAIEVHMRAAGRDAIITPDLRFGVRNAGELDLRIRVTSNGDTCVESRGTAAPELEIGDQFGESSYELRAGQHVLFEHGSLKEVVDHESSPCGCPAAPIVSVADAGMAGAGATPGNKVAATAAQHPFPAAESQGLTPGSASSAAAVPQAPAGTVHAQVAATLAYDPSAPGNEHDSLTAAPAAGGTAPAAATNAAGTAVQPTAVGPVPAPPPAAVAQAPPPPAPPSAQDLGHRIGRFFKRIFGRS